MIVSVIAISNLVLTQQIYSEETNGAHAHYREPVPLTTIEYVEKAGILAFLMLTTQSKLNSSFFQFSSRNGN